jgi:hypothetical protein
MAAMLQAALPDRQQFVAIVMAASILLLVVELVRRRSLREEYSWVWIAVALLVLGLALENGLVVAIGNLIGSATATSTLFFGAIVFLLLLALQFSVRLSRLTHRQRTLAQRVALLEQELERLRGGAPPERAEILPLRPPPTIVGHGTGPAAAKPAKQVQDGTA